MSTKAQDNLACIVGLLIFGAFLVLSFQLVSSRARLVPMPIAVISMGLLLIQLYFQNFRPDVRLNVEGTDLFQIRPDVMGTEEEAEEEARKARQNKHSELSAFVVVLVLFAMILVIGLLPAIFLFVAGYFVIYGREKPHLALLWSAIATALLYLLFIKVTNIEPWQGWIIMRLFP